MLAVVPLLSTTDCHTCLQESFCSGDVVSPPPPPRRKPKAAAGGGGSDETKKNAQKAKGEGKSGKKGGKKVAADADAAAQTEVTP